MSVKSLFTDRYSDIFRTLAIIIKSKLLDISLPHESGEFVITTMLGRPLMDEASPGLVQQRTSDKQG